MSPAVSHQVDLETHEAILALWHPEINPEPDENIEAVMDALAALAAGHSSAQDQVFAMCLAKSLLGALKQSKRTNRAQYILRATGLVGRITRDSRDAEDALRILEGFLFMSPNGTKEELTLHEKLQYAIQTGGVPDDMDEKTAAQRISRGKKREQQARVKRASTKNPPQK
ncbi:hypothetical protein [Polaromonas sp. P5_D5]